MSDNARPSKNPAALLVVWVAAQPTPHYFAAVANELNATKLDGEANLFERGPHVSITHFAYFKPPMNAFLVELNVNN